ncbi:MAG TPA: hypothetical protein VGK64_23105 [Bryobacteraceae bacterium]
MNTSRRQFAATLWAPLAFARDEVPLTLSCPSDNGLYRALPSVPRFSTPEQAIHHARPGTGVAILTGALPERLLTQARQKHLRLYIESTPSENTRIANRERGVVTSSFFGDALPPMSILSLHSCRYGPLSGGKTHLTLAKVAGFDKAVFGLPRETFPVLIEREQDQSLLASTPLSRFITARYGPSAAWIIVWQQILRWLLANPQHIEIHATPSVRPVFSASASLPADAEKNAASKAVEWYSSARLFIHPSWAYKLDEAVVFEDRVGPAPTQDMPLGDGTLGMLEGHSSKIPLDGSQPARWWIRADCVGETAMVHALAKRTRIAENLVDFLMKSKMFTGARLDPSNVAYGLLGWNEATRYYKDEDGFDVYYGDDNARCLLGLLTTSALTGETRWLRRIWLAILADFRLIGTNGHQKSRYDQAPLAKDGWQHYHHSPIVLHDMNYQAYPWAMFLWAYFKTAYAPFLERCEKGIRLSVEAYPDRWRWSNSITSQQARFLLPLAWLVRVKDTPESRSWLRKIAQELLSHQHESGAIAEWTGPPATGIQVPPTSNEKYGAGEGTLIQQNADPATDLLYTMNFALIGLHEAHAATGEASYREAADRIAAFLVRAQVHSEIHPQFHGAWYRAFDFKIWDYWASNSDSGWGAWCTESGWSQSWITTVLSLRLRKQSLWDVLRAVPAYDGFTALRHEMFPEA